MLKDKKKKNNKKSKKIIIGAIILILLLSVIILILLIQFKIIKYDFKSFALKPELFKIEDKCSVIVGQLIHTVNNEGTCMMKCKTECEVRDMKFFNLEFIEIENDCNKCSCYCK